MYYYGLPEADLPFHHLVRNFRFPDPVAYSLFWGSMMLLSIQLDALQSIKRDLLGPGRSGDHSQHVSEMIPDQLRDDLADIALSGSCHSFQPLMGLCRDRDIDPDPSAWVIITHKKLLSINICLDKARMQGHAPFQPGGVLLSDPCRSHDVRP